MGDDPVLDPPELIAYMNGWDGDAFFDALRLTSDSHVLEIGVGTGRLALRTLSAGCASFTGMDLSAFALKRARKHLANYENVLLLQGEFPKDTPPILFDRIYSSLTFLHIENKRAACQKLAESLAPGGRCVLSLDTETGVSLNMPSWSVKTFPDDAENISRLLHNAGLFVYPVRRLERAYLLTAERLQ